MADIDDMFDDSTRLENLDEYSAKVKDLTDGLIEAQSEFLSLLDKAKSSLSNYEVYKNIAKEINTHFTDIKKSNQTILDISARLGNSIVKEERIRQLITQNTNKKQLLENLIREDGEAGAALAQRRLSIEKEINDIIKEEGITIRTGAISFDDMTDYADNLNTAISSFKDNIRSLNNEIKDNLFAIQENVDQIKNLESSMVSASEEELRLNGEEIQKRRNQITDLLSINQIKQQQIDATEKEVKVYDDLVKKITLSKSEYEAVSDSIRDAVAAYNKIIDALNEINQLREEGNKKLSTEARFSEVLSKIIKGIVSSLNRIPVVGELLSKLLTRFIKLDYKSLAKAYEKGTGSMLKEFGGQIKTIFKEGGKLISIAAGIGLLGVFFSIVKKVKDAIFEYDKTITDLANRMAISKQSADALNTYFYFLSRSGKDFSGFLNTSYISMKNMSEALFQLQDYFGTSAMFSDEMLQSQIAMVKTMGLTEETAGGIQKLSLLTNKDNKTVLDSILKQNKAFMSNKKLLSEVAAVNAEISMAYKNNPELIAKAVVQAQKLGMTLDDVKKISDSLLDFETSIQNELEAELMTGKQLNFERARGLVLDGKRSEAAADLISQLGDINYISSLNPIVRGSLAKSIGLSAEELSKFTQQQEVLSKIGVKSVEELQNRYSELVKIGKTEEANALLLDIQKQKGGDILAQDIAKKDLADRYEQAMSRLKEVLVKLIPPLTRMLELFVGTLETIKNIVEVAKTLTLLIPAIGGAMIGFSLGGPAGVLAGLLSGALVGLPTVLPSSYGINDAAISPRGNIVISTPAGQMFPRNDDYVYTSTMPPEMLINNKNMISNTNEKVVIVDNSEVKESLNKLISIVEKGSNVYLDSQVIATTTAIRGNISFA